MKRKSRSFCLNQSPFLVLAALISLASTALPDASHAQNLLQGAKITYRNGADSEATAKDLSLITFQKPGTIPLSVRIEFEVKTKPAGAVLKFTKPQSITGWRLNSEPLLEPTKDMALGQLNGIPAMSLKPGRNVLEARFDQRVDNKSGHLDPISTGANHFELRPADLKEFAISTGPVLGAAGYDYFTVGCRTSMPATVTLECDGRKWTSKPGYVHLLRAEGLKQGQAYEYKLVANLAGKGSPTTTVRSKTWKVKTLSSKTPLVFAAVGDARSNPKIWGKITQEILKFHPQFVAHTGDIVRNGLDYASWDNQFAAPASEFLATIPCFFAFGNHEDNAGMLDQLFGYPNSDRNYTETIGPAQIFIIDRYFSNWEQNSPKVDWLQKELAQSKARFVFAFAHPPAWSSGSHDTDPVSRNVIFPILQRYSATAFIAGHDHCYERSEPGTTTMLIAGGGGAELHQAIKQPDNPFSAIYRSEYNFLIFTVDENRCEVKAYAFGDASTPDDQRKTEVIDSRVWGPRK